MKILIAKSISWFLRVFLKIRYGKKISFGRNVILNHKFKFSGPGRLIIEDNVNLWSHKEPNEFHTYSKNAEIKIGKRSRLNGAQIQCREKIEIGQDCLIGSAIIMDNDFHSIYYDKRNDPNFIKSNPVIIKNRVWIGGQAAILKGVTIGEESVVAFRALVTKNVEAKKVVAGNPGVVVKDIG